MESGDSSLNADLYSACKVGDFNLAKALIERMADVDGDGDRIPLIAAAKHGHVACMELLLKCGAKVNGVNQNGDSALLLVCQKPQFDAIELLLDHGARITTNICHCLCYHLEANHFRTDHSGLVRRMTNQMLTLLTSFVSLARYSFKHGLQDLSSLLLTRESLPTVRSNYPFALYYSAKYDWVDIAERLLNKDFDVDTLWHMKTALYGACKYQSENVLEVLLRHYPNPYLHNMDSDIRRHLIFIACQQDNKRIVRMLLVSGCFLAQKSAVESPHSVLHIAYDSGKWDLVQMMLSMGFYVNDVDCSGMTILHKACRSGNLDQVLELLESGANINWINYRGETPLHLACVCSESNCKGVVELLLNSGANCNGLCGETPLYRACLYQMVDAVKLLLEKGADCNLTLAKQNPLMAACHTGNVAILNLLLQKPGIQLDIMAPLSDSDTSNAYLSTPLCAAAQNGNADAVKLLLIHGADANFADNDGMLPLEHVVTRLMNTPDTVNKGICMEILQLLLSYRSDANHSLDGFTLLDRTCIAGMEEVVSLLLQHGANPFHINAANESALHTACRNNHVNHVQIMLKSISKTLGVSDEPLYTTTYSLKPPLLHFTAENGNNHLISLLLSYGFSVNERDSIGKTALHHAANSQIAETLIANGADIDCLDNDDVSPLCWASLTGKVDVALTLLVRGATPYYTKLPLYAACFEKHLQLVRLWLERNANTELLPSNLCVTGLCNKRKLPSTDEGLHYGKRHCQTMSYDSNDDCNGLFAQIAHHNDDNLPSLLLCIACKWGFLSVISTLLEYGANADFMGNDSETPLYCAIAFLLFQNKMQIANERHESKCFSTENEATVNDKRNAHVNVVDQLIKHGACVNRPTYLGKTPLHCTVDGICHQPSLRPLWEVLDILLVNGADVNALSFNYESPLYTASAFVYPELLLKLLEHSDCTRSNFGKNPLLIPCEQGNAVIVKLLLEHGIHPSQNAIFQSVSPLCIAIRNGHVEVVQLLLSHDANFNAFDLDGSTPMHVASEKFSDEPTNDNFQIILIDLIKHGASTSISCRNGETLLYEATEAWPNRLVETLLQFNADPNLSYNGRYPLAAACAKHDSLLVELLLYYSADPNRQSTTKTIPGAFLPLCHASQHGDFPIAEQLIARGADVNKRGSDGLTPLHIACKARQLQTVRLLLDNGANPLLKAGTSTVNSAKVGNKEKKQDPESDKSEKAIRMDFVGKTALHFAVKSLGYERSFEVCKAVSQQESLIERYFAEETSSDTTSSKFISSTVSFCSSNKQICKHKTANTSNFTGDDMISLLLQNGADVNAVDEKDQTPLYMATKRGLVDIVQALLSQNADPNGTSLNRYPLSEACRLDNVKLVEILLEAGANPNMDLSKVTKDDWFFDPTHDLPLFIALQEKSDAIAEMLMAHGACVNVEDNIGQTPLYIATSNNMTETVRRLLLQYKVDPDCSTSDKNALVAACALKSIEMAAILLNGGANPNVDVDNVDNEDLETFHRLPLCIAAENYDVSLAKLLLDHGAKVDDEDIGSFCALHVALDFHADWRWGTDSNDHDHDPDMLEICQLLLKGGANPNKLTSRGDSPLRLALQGVYMEPIREVVTLLVNHGANFAEPTRKNRLERSLSDCLCFSIEPRTFAILIDLFKCGMGINMLCIGCESLNENNDEDDENNGGVEEVEVGLCRALVLAGHRPTPTDLEDFSRNITFNSSPSVVKKLIDFSLWLNEESRKPPSLMRQCRTTIRQSLSVVSGYTSIIPMIDSFSLPRPDERPLPVKLKSYLQFEGPYSEIDFSRVMRFYLGD